MSSTRHPKRDGDPDVFETPAWCVHRLLDVWRPRPGIWLEPAVGDGAVISAIRERTPVDDGRWISYDVRTVNAIAEFHAQCDFLAVDVDAPYSKDLTAVVTNPPYSLAEEFIRHSRALCPHADLVFLLRLAFLASAKRLPLWEDVGIPDVCVLPNRPSFTGGGTDSADYAWFVWPREKRAHGTVGVLAKTPKAERCG